MKGKKRSGAILMGLGGLLLTALAIAAALSFYMADRASNYEQNPMSTAKTDDCPIDWEYWQGVNPDIVAWVEIPGTNINQPVVAAPADDPKYYLSHDVYRSWNYCGCPYLDAGSTNGIDSWSAVIFGHNIGTPPSMFHDLASYHDPGFAESHPDVVIYTPAGTKKLRVAGVRTIAGWNEAKRVDFSSIADFWAYRNECLDAADATYDRGEDFGQLVTLCSCSYFFNPANERTLVYAS